MKPEPWWIGLLRLFIESFLGWIRLQGREEVEDQLKEEHDADQRKFNEIDSRPVDPDGALERMRRARRAQDALRGTGQGDDGNHH